MAQNQEMLGTEQSTRISVRRQHRWADVSCLNYDVHWDAIPGWTRFTFDQPTLCLLIDEIGGRAEFRLRADTPSEGEYFGTNHLTLLASAVPLTLYSASLRSAQCVCIALHPKASSSLTADQATLVAHAPSRLMFQDHRLYTCAKMLGDYDGDDERDPYGLGLRNALLAALVGVLSTPARAAPDRLTGAPLARVLIHIAEHLDERVGNEHLAQLAGMSCTDFGHAFREATGLSPQRWQMDARVRFAQRLMVDDPALSLSLIASRSGFADQSHFSRAFLDILGATPTAWLHQRR
jgi:AraC family transcriptional regulator